MLLGMGLADAIRRSTVAPAKAIGRYPEMGTLSVGQTADIAVMELRGGVFAYKDAWGKKYMGKQRLTCAATVREGETVWDRDGRGYPEWTKAGEYEVIQ
jgi:dihydroorotase